jgi:hypothetical protein
MHNSSNGPWREFRKRVGLKRNTAASEALFDYILTTDLFLFDLDSTEQTLKVLSWRIVGKAKNHDGKCSDRPYLYISLQEWAVGSKMKSRVR